jgi:hypothetical protein
MVLGGCAGKDAPDNTVLFIRCLEEEGGQQVTSPSHLAGYSSKGVEQGSGAALDSVSYSTIDVTVGNGDRRRALVFVDYVRDEPASVPLPEPAELLRRARHGATGMRALVLMPPATDFDAPITRCREMAAPGQATP